MTTSEPTYRGIVVKGYTNHVGSTTDGGDNVFVAATRDGPNLGDVDVVIRRRQSGTGEWTEVYTFTQRKYGKHGYCSLECVGAHLVCLLCEVDAENGQVVTKEYLILNVCVPKVRAQ